MPCPDRKLADREAAIIKQYNLHAELYADEIRENVLQAESFYFLLDLVRKTKGNVSGGVWLDAGCGPGCFASSTLNLNYTKLIGVDLSDEMIRIAKAKGVYSKIYNDSLADLKSVKRGSVGVYFSNNVFHFINAVGEEYLERVLSEAFDVLKDGGLMAINMSSTGTSESFIEAYRRVVNREIKDRGFFDPKDNILGVTTRFVSDYPIGSMELKVMLKKVKETGFRVVRAVKRYEPVRYNDRQDYVRSMSSYAKHLYLRPFEHLDDSTQEKVFARMVREFVTGDDCVPFINDHFMNYIIAVKEG